MSMRKVRQAIIMLVFLSAANASAFFVDTRLVSGASPFVWPDTQESAITANKTPAAAIESFINSLRARVPQYLPIHIRSFRFDALEKRRFYLVAISGGDRFSWNLDVLVPEGQAFQYSEMTTNTPFPLAMQMVDMDGDGVDELVTAEWAAGYQGASTPPIYWYTVWRFRKGVPHDASAEFPDFYRGFVLGQLPYLDELLGKLQSVDPGGVRAPLAEVEYIRFKFRRLILGEKNAGLEEALGWVESKNTTLQIMGIWSLSEMPAAEAAGELGKLTASPNLSDLAKAALARRGRRFPEGR